MLSTYTYPKFEYRTPPELNGKPKQRHPVVVIGAGPVGLATAIDLAQQVIPDMRARGAGWILNISSRAAVKPVGPPFEAWFATGNSSVYGMCKAALERVSLGMAAELHSSNIAVNTLAPWDNVPTPGAGNHDLVEDFKIEREEVIAQAALELCAGDPQRLTGRVAYSQPLLAEMSVVARNLNGGPLL